MSSLAFPLPGLLGPSQNHRAYTGYFPTYADPTSAAANPAFFDPANRIGPSSTSPPMLSGRDAAFTAIAAAVPKRQRVPRACDVCRRKKIRCNLTQSLVVGEVECESDEDVQGRGDGNFNGTTDDAVKRTRPARTCLNCIQAGVPCTFTKSTAKRGPNRGYIHQLETRLAALESSVNTEEKDKLSGSENSGMPVTTIDSHENSDLSGLDPMSVSPTVAVASGLVALAAQAEFARGSPHSSSDDAENGQHAVSGQKMAQVAYGTHKSTSPSPWSTKDEQQDVKPSLSLSPNRIHRSIYGATFAADSRPPSAPGGNLNHSHYAANDVMQQAPRKKIRLSNDGFPTKAALPEASDSLLSSTNPPNRTGISRVHTAPHMSSTSPGSAVQLANDHMLHPYPRQGDIPPLSASHQVHASRTIAAHPRRPEISTTSRAALPSISDLLQGMPNVLGAPYHINNGYSGRRFTVPAHDRAVQANIRLDTRADHAAPKPVSLHSAAGEAQPWLDKGSQGDASPVYSSRSPNDVGIAQLAQNGMNNLPRTARLQEGDPLSPKSTGPRYLPPILPRSMSISPLPERRPRDYNVSRTSAFGNQLRPSLSATASQNNVSYANSNAVHDTYGLRQTLLASPAVRTFAAVPLSMLEDGFQGSQTLLQAANLAVQPSATTYHQQGSDDWATEIGNIIGNCMRPLSTVANAVLFVVPREVEALIICYLDALRRGRTVSGILGAISGKLTILQSRDVDIKRYNAVLTLLAAWHTAAYLNRKMYPAAPTITNAEVLYEALGVEDHVVRAVCHVTYTLDRLCRRYIDSGQRPVYADQLELAGPSALASRIDLPPRESRLLVNFDCMFLQLNFLFNQDTTSYPTFETIAHQRRGIRNILDEYESCGAGDILLGPHMLASAALTATYCVCACTELAELSSPAAGRSLIALRDDFSSLLDMLQGLLYHLRGGSAGNAPQLIEFGDISALYDSVSRFIFNSSTAGKHDKVAKLSTHRLVRTYFQLGYMGVMLADDACLTPTM